MTRLPPRPSRRPQAGRASATRSRSLRRRVNNPSRERPVLISARIRSRSRQDRHRSRCHSPRRGAWSGPLAGRLSRVRPSRHERISAGRVAKRSTRRSPVSARWSAWRALRLAPDSSLIASSFGSAQSRSSFSRAPRSSPGQQSHSAYSRSWPNWLPCKQERSRKRFIDR